MSKKQMKMVYQSLLESGDLLDMYPDLTGNWKEDEKDFRIQYEFNNENLLGDFEISLDGEF